VSSTLRVVPLGGLGEIGMNCMALEAEGDVLVVDCGVMFPDRLRGVDVVHPDFAWLLERPKRVRAVVLTHGHEDHIGALPYLLKHLDVPVHGPRYALRLAADRLAEHDLPRPPRLVAAEPGKAFDAGCFRVEPIQVTHSTVEATALALTTPAGVVVHSGDFKIDREPPGGEAFDADRLRALGDRGVRLLMSDSTNAWAEGSSGSEADAARALSELISNAPHRVVVAIFASNVHRLRTLLDAARMHGRRVCLLGRSVAKHVDLAVETGHLRDLGSLRVAAEDAASVPRNELLVIATGTQAEPAAAMARLARGQHPALSLDPGDEVIFSSRIIPGNELTVHALIADLLRRDVRVHFRLTDPRIHVSGHAYADELTAMIELVRPRAFLPVHGTLLHLRRHAQLAARAGIEHTLVVENGTVVEVTEDAMHVAGVVPSGRVHVDAGEEIPDAVLRDRALLGEQGIAVVVVKVDREGRVSGEPEVMTRGVVQEEEEPELMNDLRAYVAADLKRHRTPRKDLDEAELEERARRALKRFLGRRLGRRPLTFGMVVRVP